MWFLGLEAQAPYEFIGLLGLDAPKLPDSWGFWAWRPNHFMNA